MYEKRSFYKKVFTDYSQNSIRNYIHDFNVKNGQKVVKFTYNVEKLSDEQLYLISHFSYGTIQMLMEWLLEKYQMTAEEVTRLQYKIMPEFLETAYMRYYEKNPPNPNQELGGT